MFDLILAHTTLVMLWLAVGFVSGTIGTILYNSSRTYPTSLLTVGDLLYALFILSLSGPVTTLFVILGIILHWASKINMLNKRIL